MLKVSSLVLMLSASAISYAQSSAVPPVEIAKEEEVGPTLPLIKKVQNKEESRIHFGYNLGINNPEGSRSASPELGIEVGFQPLIPFGLSLELSTSRFDSSHDEFHRRTTLLLRGTYNFGGDIPVIRYSYFGLATGAVFLSDGTEVGIAPVAGFDIPLTDDHAWSLGFMAKYLFVVSEDPDSLITSASLKLWF